MLLYSESEMKKEDYMFCIGYQGDTALIDGQAKKKYAKIEVPQLIEQGLFKAALCSAIFDNDSPAVQHIISAYNTISGSSLSGLEDAMRLWGVVPVSDAVEKTLVIK
jgi:hypothetical protein